MSILKEFSLAGRTALVTGCKRGIGKGMAIALAKHVDHFHFELVTTTITLENGSEGYSYRNMH